MIKKIYYYYSYIYYREYCWNYYLWKEPDKAAFNTTLWLTFSQISFIFIVDLHINSLLESKEIAFLFNNFYISFFIFTILFLANYFLFEHKSNYLKIEEDFKKLNESKLRWYFKGLIIFTVTLAPIILLFIIM